MATNRDVQLVIRARDEASKALNSIAAELDALVNKQAGAARSGSAFGASLAGMVAQMAQFEKVSGLVSQAADRAEAAIQRTQNSIRGNGQALAAVVAQLANARDVIARGQQGIVATLFTGGDATEQITRIKAAKAAVLDLEGQQRKLSAAVAGGQQTLAEQQRGFAELAAMANSAAAAVAAVNLAQQEVSRRSVAPDTRSGAQRLISGSATVDPAMVADLELDRVLERVNNKGKLVVQANKVAAEEAERQARAQALVTAEMERQARLAAAARANRSGAERLVEGRATVDPALLSTTSLDQVLGRVNTKSKLVAQAGKEAADQAERKAKAEAIAAAEMERQAQAAAAARASRSGAEKLVAGEATVDRAAISSTTLDQVLRRVNANNGAQARQSASKAAASAADQEAAALQRVLEKANPLAAIQRQLAADLEVLRAAMARGAISAAEFATQEENLRKRATLLSEALQRTGKGEAGKPTLFGLKPYELTNLGYQINDIITGLASGQPIMQIIAQQGGQVLQLMPQIGSRIVAAFTSPAFLGAAAVFGAIALGIKEAYDQADRLRQIQGALDALGDGAMHSADSLNESVKALRQYRVSATDALTAVKTLVRNGVDDSKVVQFGKSAKDLSDVMGIDLKQALQDVGTAFTGNYESVAKLDDQLNFLTAAEREHIRTLFEEGRAGEARVAALDAFSRKMGKAAGDMRGPWSDALTNLNNAWHNFLETFANSRLIEPFVRILNDLANVLNRLAGATDNATAAANRIAPAGTTGVTASGQTVGVDPLDPTNQFNGGQRVVGPATDTRANGADSEETKQSNDTLHAMERERALQKLREQGAQAVDRLRRLNEGFLTAAEQRRRIALAGELAATKAIGDERVKAQARANAQEEEARKIRQEQEQFDTANSSPSMITRRLIMQREGFRSTPYRDSDGRLRIGFGSDTTTSAGGAISTVTAGTRTTMEAAIRDLDRRIGEFQDGIKKLIGGDRFNAFSAQQQAALTSLAYNYGTLARTFDAQGRAHGAGIADIVRTGSTKQIADAIRRLGGDNGGINRSRRNAEAALFEMPNAAIEADNQKQAEDAQQRQEKLNVTIREANEERARQTAELEKQNTLVGEALVQEQIRAAGEKAVADLQRNVDQQNANLKPYEKKLELTQEQIEATRQLAEQEARAQQAAALAQAQEFDATRPMNDLSAQRDAIRGQIEALRAVGDGAGADALMPRLNGINDQLRQAIENAIKFYEALDPATDPLHRTREQIDAVVARLKTAQTETTNWVNIMGISGETIAHTFASSATSALDRFAQAVANGANAFSSLGDAFLSFASDFLRQIAQMIQQQIIFNLVSGILRAVSGAVAPNASLMPSVQSTFAANPGIFHIGGIAGAATSTRPIDAAWFAGALRYHTGGVAGLRPDEVPAILQKGEEVLTKTDPRHRNNGGGATGGVQPKVDLKIVNTIDAGDMVSEGLATAAGQQAFFNMVRANRRAFKQAMS